MLSFEILPGLPASGEWAVPFPQDPRGSFREGLVVRFFDEADGTSWVGNFRQSFRGSDLVTRHPDGHHVVVAGGEGYLVDPLSRRLEGTFGFSVQEVALADENFIVLADHTQIYIFTATETWASERLSWDGFRGLKVVEGVLSGECWSGLSESWHAFSLDLATREALGAIYPLDFARARKT